MQLSTKRQSEHIPKACIAVAIEAHEVDIIGGEFVEECYTLDTLALVVRNIKSEAFAQGYVRTNASGERIIATIILGGLLHPEVVAKAPYLLGISTSSC